MWSRDHVIVESTVNQVLFLFFLKSLSSFFNLPVIPTCLIFFNHGMWLHALLFLWWFYQLQSSFHENCHGVCSVFLKLYLEIRVWVKTVLNAQSWGLSYFDNFIPANLHYLFSFYLTLNHSAYEVCNKYHIFYYLNKISVL